MRDAVNRPLKTHAKHADLGRSWRFLPRPNIDPHGVVTAPVRAVLAAILPSALGDQSKAVDACLERKAHGLLVGVPALYRLDVLGKRI
jgi:hypothetical protein